MPRYSDGQLEAARIAGPPKAGAAFDDADSWHSYQDVWYLRFMEQLLPDVGDKARGAAWKAATRKFRKMQEQISGEEQISGGEQFSIGVTSDPVSDLATAAAAMQVSPKRRVHERDEPGSGNPAPQRLPRYEGQEGREGQELEQLLDLSANGAGPSNLEARIERALEAAADSAEAAEVAAAVEAADRQRTQRRSPQQWRQHMQRMSRRQRKPLRQLRLSSL